ncbi:hypothetical protein AALA22_12835 [Anaerovoracaceae bacterium 41-7]|jgi:hypothetical protein|uniref:Uncharacterized protein n=1 Tax=Anaerotruncus colihominis TaxID=169435 RepID=A0A845QP58_9FIRM|nr:MULTISPECIES: hypothetical protein [Clostridia]MCI9640675.1 hypothetical protein [Emergencia sp.]NBH62503.1 hypothetical protein [Anaerotruncus colihominis]NCF00235.1 hypothetical protein [Emergencia sp. 1XD21-10]NCF03158.1 hypothetical protein [Anaerotruncus sp. 80]
METKNEKNKKQKILIIILLIAVAFMGAGLFYVLNSNRLETSKTAVIVHTDEKLSDTSGGQVRIRINSAVQIYEDTMQDLAFANLNEGRQLQCRIKVGDSYVYDSGLVKSGDAIQADIVDTSTLKQGKNQAIAEIYNYDMDNELIGQTNTIIDLYLND